MPPDSGPPEIFDRRLRRLRRDRAQPGFAAHDFLRAAMIEGLLDRLDMVTRRFARALDLGCADGGLASALRARGMEVVACDAGPRFARAADGACCDEDRLPFPPESFDLIVSAGVLDTVNDLPGALIQCRRALRPDGLLLAALTGAGSLPVLRRALVAADTATGGTVSARIHPQIDVRSAGDLLARAGFALPVTDGEGLDVRYGGVAGLLADLRGMAATNQLTDQRPPWIGRARLAALAKAFAAQAEPDGRVRERFEIIFLTGWAPGPDQPRPARRGSATASLAAALEPAS